MTREEKELLLKDLGARLQYGIKCTTKLTIYNDVYIVQGVYEDTVFIDCPVYEEGDDEWMIESIIPFLRPMSSMTDEEIDKMWNIWENNAASEAASKITDFLNEKHLDHHHLIEKGLALEATEEMYKKD